MAQLTNLFEVRCKDGIVQLDLETDLYSCRFAPWEQPATTAAASSVWRDPPPLAAPIGLGDVLYFVLAYVSALVRFPGRAVSTLGREGWPGARRRGAAVHVLVLARRFERMSLYLPFGPACLLATYALRRYLRFHGEDADWVVGVQLFPFRAHCWLAIDEVLLAERAHLIEDYEPIVRFAAMRSMKSFVACVWPEHDKAAAQAIQRIEALLANGSIAYGVAERKPGFLIAAHRVPVRASSQGWYLVGDVFDGDALEIVDRANASAKRAGVDEFGTYCQHLADNRWGRYLALLPGRSTSGTVSTFVDPIGMREVVTWQAAGVRLFTSDPAAWLAHLPPPELAIDVSALDKLVTSRVAITDLDPFVGVTRLEPGVLVHWDEKGRTRERRIWMPHALCRHPNTVADGHDLARRVDACVRAWSQTTSVSVVELSGGLDSAMVAASLARAQPPSGSFSAYTDGRAGDERRFSRAIARHLQIPNHEYALPSHFDERVFAKLAVDWRPGIGSATLFHDAALADYGVRLGAQTLFTGRGGDAVFFQHPTALVAADPWPHRRKDHREQIEALAQWSRSSVWAVARHAWLPTWSMPPTIVGRRHPITGLLSRAAPDCEAAAWPGPLHRLSAVKRMQVEAIGGDRSAFGPSQCARSMDVIHPLLSQPIVEYGLSISAMTLTAGRRDRALARDGFAGRLPATVLTRRGKGSLTTYFGRTLAKSTPFLREYLLGGALQEARLIDESALASILTPEHLIQHDCYAQLIALLQTEAWLRAWRDRLAQPRS